MIDTKCYSCLLTEDGPTDIADTEYVGNGKFKCTRCNEILDLSETTYVVEIERIVDDKTLFTTFLKLDDRLKEFENPEEDIEDLFDNLEAGKYSCDVYIHWFPCCDDWDVNVDLFESRKIPEPKTQSNSINYEIIKAMTDRELFEAIDMINNELKFRRQTSYQSQITVD